jgi:hypothetical protein
VGFWDFIAPDLDDFLEISAEVLPAAVAIGPVVLSADELAEVAYKSPGSGAGLALRSYYQARQLGLSSTLADAVWAGINAQAAGGAFGDGPGVGGSFSWEARPVVAALIIPNVYRVAIEAQVAGRNVTNVVGVRGSGPGLAAAAAGAVHEAWTVGGFAPLANLPSSYVLSGVTATDLSSASGQVIEVPGGQAGQQSGQIATTAACALVKLGGGTRSRSSRGRLFFGPLTEGAIEANGRTLAAGTVTSISQAFDVFRAGLLADGFTLCVISPTLGSATDVASHSVDSTVATQRRRLRG